MRMWRQLLPPTTGWVAVFRVVAGEALVASGVVVFEDGEGKAGEAEAVHMHLIRGQPGVGERRRSFEFFPRFQRSDESSFLSGTCMFGLVVV